MLKPEERFFAPSGNIYPGGPSTWHIMDWDQRRLISVTMDEELESEDPAIEHLQKHVDGLAPDVFEIRVSPQGDLVSTSTDRDDDNTLCPYYPPLEATERPHGVEAISRSALEELDRLGPLVDLVRCLRSPDPDRKLVFKYYFLDQRLSYVWHEMNLWMRLPKHPHIVAFDSIIVDELEGRCIGFTTEYVPGGTLEENKCRVFKFRWLTQLIAVIDELNLNLGIAHQDVAPRNLLIDELRDSLMIFDFNFSVRMGEPGYSEARNDIKGVFFTIYEIITRDETLRAVRHEEQDVLEIEQKDWIQHPDVQLDRPVSEFREALLKWSERRRGGRQITAYKDAPNFIDWPDTPQPPPSEVIIYYGGKPVTELQLLWSTERKRMLDQGKTVLNWQRPPQSKLKPGDRILETGEFITRG
ncbi:hypothetical protein F66182_9690 [Fusarium sp. NRRL 66182]|nr:hypothetical protein F66182_9690 [Fusarium sp. NRRL 66182]